MKLVIIESPFAADTRAAAEANVEYARRALRDSINRGEAPLASHLLYPHPKVLLDERSEERSRGIQMGYEWMTVANMVAFYCDRGWSPGMIAALKVATCVLYKPVVKRLLWPSEVPETPAEVQDIFDRKVPQ